MTLNLLAKVPPIRDEGGALRVGRTQVTLESVLWAHQRGATPEEITDQFPTLELADVYDVVAYYLRHRAEVDQYLAQQEKTFDEVAERVKQQFPQDGIRARVLDRRNR